MGCAPQYDWGLFQFIGKANVILIRWPALRRWRSDQRVSSPHYGFTSLYCTDRDRDTVIGYGPAGDEALAVWGPEGMCSRYIIARARLTYHSSLVVLALIAPYQHSPRGYVPRPVHIANLLYYTDDIFSRFLATLTTLAHSYLPILTRAIDFWCVQYLSLIHIWRCRRRG